jgi:hypothetical protein
MGDGVEAHGQRFGHELRIGPHIVRLEPPDLYLVTLGGDMELAETNEIVRQIHLFAEGKPWVFGISDNHNLKSFPLTIRNASVRLPANVKGIAIIRTSPRVRLIATFLGRVSWYRDPLVQAPTRMRLVTAVAPF